MYKQITSLLTNHTKCLSLVFYIIIIVVKFLNSNNLLQYSEKFKSFILYYYFYIMNLIIVGHLKWLTCSGILIYSTRHEMRNKILRFLLIKFNSFIVSQTIQSNNKDMFTVYMHI